MIESRYRFAATVAHEMGHNFGMRHDSSGNSCEATGNVMNARLTSNPPNIFSSCSKSYYMTSLSRRACLNDQPKRVWGDPDCGNGFIEGSLELGDLEECDCGARDCTCS